MPRVEITATTMDTVTFTVWVDGDRYDCPIARAVVHALSSEDGEQAGYHLLKEQVGALVESLVRVADVTLSAALPASPRLH